MRVPLGQMMPKRNVPLRVCPEVGDCAGFECYHHQPHVHTEDCDRRCEPSCGCTLPECIAYIPDYRDAATQKHMKPQRKAVQP